MSELLHPEVEELFRLAELSQQDIRTIRAIEKDSKLVCAHGSGITGQLSADSDLDLLVVTDRLNQRIADQHGVDPSGVDYESTNIRGENGRKISLHYEQEEFRMNYGERPIAVEFRDTAHSKRTAQSEYSLTGIGNEGYYLIRFGCPKVVVDGKGTYNITPQTGYFELNGHRGVPLMDGLQDHHIFNILERRIIDPVTGQTYDAADVRDTVLLHGLESNKATNDIPISQGKTEEYDLYVRPVMEHSVAMFANHLGKNPIDDMTAILMIHADYRNREAGRLKADPQFINSAIRPKLEQYVPGKYR